MTAFPFPPPSTIRPGEVPFEKDGADADDARLAYIGRVRSPHRTRADCPRNIREARERGGQAFLEIEPAFCLGLTGLAAGQTVHLLTWLDASRRDLALQTPRHAAEPRGTFSLRSPVRPNPIGLHLVRITEVDIESGFVGIDAIDVLDSTPLLDIKPYIESVDIPPAMAAAQTPTKTR